MIVSLHPFILNEINLMQRTPTRSTIYQWSATIHIGDKSWMLPQVNTTALERDYIKNWADIFSISTKVDPVLFNNVLYPYRDQLEIQLTRKAKYSQHTGSLVNELFQSSRFKAQVYASNHPQAAAVNNVTTVASHYDKAMLEDYSFQLYDKIVDQVRTTSSYTTNARQAQPIPTIRSIIGHLGMNPGDDQSISIKGVDVAPGYTEEVREQIIIPEGTKLYEVPAVVNKRAGGIYNTGFAYYLQDGMWYIFSPFDTKRYHTGGYKKSLTVINVPPQALPGIECTHRDTGDQLIILATGNTAVSDHSERAAMNEGTGTRFVDANALKENPFTYTDGKVEADPKKFVSEFVSSNRPDKMNLVTGNGVNITANYRLEYSKLAERQGMYIGVVWEYAIPELIYPGMPVKYIYIENDLPVELYGIVTGVSSKDSMVNGDVTNPVYTSVGFVRLFVERRSTQ